MQHRFIVSLHSLWPHHEERCSFHTSLISDYLKYLNKHWTTKFCRIDEELCSILIFLPSVIVQASSFLLT